MESSSPYKVWKPLSQGAIVDIIAPAGRCEPNTLKAVKNLVESWKLTPRISPQLFGTDLLCANSDENRFEQLKEALFNPSSHAVWCLRGGYGCTRLIPKLLNLPYPKISKLFIGFSDITALHLFLQQQWHWQTLHGPVAHQIASNSIDSESIQEFKKLIFGQLPQLEFSLFPLNDAANHNRLIHSYVTGGTLTLVQTSLGTPWQIDANDKILFLEEVNEASYRIDRMLQHLQQSGVLSTVKAILFGDFVSSEKSNSRKLTQSVLKRFAQTQQFPVLHCPGIGHGQSNRGLPLATKTELDLCKQRLTIKIIS